MSGQGLGVCVWGGGGPTNITDTKCLEQNNVSLSETRPCKPGEFMCSSGQCIPEADICKDGVRENGQNIGCGDNSHLLNCSGYSKR